MNELFDRNYRNIILDMGDVRLADRGAVRFLRDCEAGGMTLENCPAYIREWMDKEADLRTRYPFSTVSATSKRRDS